MARPKLLSQTTRLEEIWMRLAASLAPLLILACAACADEAPQRSPRDPWRVVSTPTDCATRSVPGPFDRACTAQALGSIDLSRCSSAAHGQIHVSTTFDRTGDVLDAVVDRPGEADPAVVACIERAFRDVHVPPYNGGPVTVGKMVRW